VMPTVNTMTPLPVKVTPLPVTMSVIPNKTASVPEMRQDKFEIWTLFECGVARAECGTKLVATDEHRWTQMFRNSRPARPVLPFRVFCVFRGKKPI
jgi:hypothetical protein